MRILKLTTLVTDSHTIDGHSSPVHIMPGTVTCGFFGSVRIHSGPAQSLHSLMTSAKDTEIRDHSGVTAQVIGMMRTLPDSGTVTALVSVDVNGDDAP